MPEYKVEFPLWHGKKKYMPGEPVSMSETLAKPLLDRDDISEIVPQQPQEITEDAMVAAIHRMEPMDATQWTNDSKPQIPALEALLKGKITAKDRDAAWDRYQKETK